MDMLLHALFDSGLLAPPSKRHARLHRSARGALHMPTLYCDISAIPG
jgi:hypothetical protein